MKNRIITILLVLMGIILLSLLSPKVVKAGDFYGADITWEWEYHESGAPMAYGLCVPSNEDLVDKLPVIVWLHGSGETAVSSGALKGNGLPDEILDRWDSYGYDGFGAYVLCPHLQESNGYWNTDENVSRLKGLLDYFISKYNVDTENIVLMGNSRGGTGAMYIGNYLADYFSKCVVCSGYSTDVYPKIPTICFVGTSDDPKCVSAAKTYASRLGEDNIYWVGTSHGSVPHSALAKDGGEFHGIRKSSAITVQT